MWVLGAVAMNCRYCRYCRYVGVNVCGGAKRAVTDAPYGRCETGRFGMARPLSRPGAEMAVEAPRLG